MNEPGIDLNRVLPLVQIGVQPNINSFICNSCRIRAGNRIPPAVKAIFVLLLLLTLPTGLFGGPMNAEQARNAVLGWLKADPFPLRTMMGQQIKEAVTFSDTNGVALYYVVYLEPSGFAIVAADDLIEPIIGFAPSGRFDPSTDNPLGALVSNDLPGRMARVKGIEAAKVKGPFLAARNKWERFKNIEQSTNGIEMGISSVSDVRVAPLTQTTWDQSTVGGNACYNYYTPPYAAGSSANYVCGCVATAMAQLIRYWQYPISGVGTASFTIYVTDVAQSRNLLGGDGAGGPYDWGDMVLSPNGSSTDTQRRAIGALCADAGVSVSMDYNIGGSGASGASMEEVQGELVQTFGYANAICGDNGGNNIGSGLIGMVNPNLDAGCPVLLGITDGTSGHAIVCDGYGYNLSTLYHHLNLGWSGSYTAWYNLPNIDAGGYAFNSVDACVYNVWTNGTGEIISGRITDNTGAPIAGVGVTATRTGGGTYTATSNTNGIYALAGIPSSSTYTISPSKIGYVFTNQTVSTGSSADYSATSGNQWAINFIAAQDNLGVTPATNFVSTGVVGGPFSPSSQTYALTNTGTNALNWAASKTSSWLNLSATNGTLAAAGSTNVVAIINAASLAVGSYSDTITFSNRTSGFGNITRQVTLTVNLACFYYFTLDTDPGWTRQGEWAFGHPTGQGGTSHGYPDPTNGATGTNVFGVNLSGDYSTTVGGPYYLTAGPFNFAGCTNVILQFQRWLNSDYQPYVYATIDVSSDGTTWTSVFSNGTTPITDNAWTNCQYDISATAANQTNVYVRWGYQVGSEAYAYSGWNIDDIQFIGAPGRVPRVGVVPAGTNLVINCVNWSPAATFYVVASTNLTLPCVNWPVIATNCFDASGCFQFTNGLGGTNATQRFFRIRLP